MTTFIDQVISSHKVIEALKCNKLKVSEVLSAIMKVECKTEQFIYYAQVCRFVSNPDLVEGWSDHLGQFDDPVHHAIRHHCGLSSHPTLFILANFSSHKDKIKIWCDVEEDVDILTKYHCDIITTKSSKCFARLMKHPAERIIILSQVVQASRCLWFEPLQALIKNIPDIIHEIIIAISSDYRNKFPLVWEEIIGPMCQSFIQLLLDKKLLDLVQLLKYSEIFPDLADCTNWSPIARKIVGFSAHLQCYYLGYSEETLLLTPTELFRDLDQLSQDGPEKYCETRLSSVNSINDSNACFEPISSYSPIDRIGFRRGGRFHYFTRDEIPSIMKSGRHLWTQELLSQFELRRLKSYAELYQEYPECEPLAYSLNRLL